MTRLARPGYVITKDEDGKTTFRDLEGPVLPVDEATEFARQGMLRMAANHDDIAAKMNDDGREWGHGYATGVAYAARRAAEEIVIYALAFSQPAEES